MDYKNGKIYSIRNTIDDDIYVGSTCQPLSKRTVEHRRSINSKRDFNIALYAKMRQLGVEHFYIELLETCPCNSKDELRAKEGEYIRSLSTLNKRIESRTVQEWRQDNQDYLRERQKEYYNANKGYFAEKSKQYVSENREKTKAYKQTYNDLHKEQLKEYKSRYYQTNKEHILKKCLCECGQYHVLQYKARHQQTKKHLETMKNLNYSNNTDTEQEENNTDEREGEIHTQTE